MHTGYGGWAKPKTYVVSSTAVTLAAPMPFTRRWAATTPVTGSARGPYCMMGVCFDCLVEIDGEGNRQACMIEARDGMVVKRQMGARKIDGKAGS